MKVNLIDVTPWSRVLWAYSQTRHDQKDVNIHPLEAYISEHSPIRERVFRFECSWPDFVHTHFVRHHTGINHYVSTHREDRGYIGATDRNTERAHAFTVNAQQLISMAKVRLCNKAHKTTREAMKLIKREVSKFDPFLSFCMVPQCVYRRGCPELYTCGECSFLEQDYRNYIMVVKEREPVNYFFICPECGGVNMCRYSLLNDCSHCGQSCASGIRPIAAFEIK